MKISLLQLKNNEQNLTRKKEPGLILPNSPAYLPDYKLIECSAAAIAKYTQNKQTNKEL